jgi:hypothetical protein
MTEHGAQYDHIGSKYDEYAHGAQYGCYFTRPRCLPKMWRTMGKPIGVISTTTAWSSG